MYQEVICTARSFEDLITTKQFSVFSAKKANWLSWDAAFKPGKGHVYGMLCHHFKPDYVFQVIQEYDHD